MSKVNLDVEFTKKNLAEISAHKKMFGIPEHIGDMSETDYRVSVMNEAFFWIDHGERLRSQFSGEILAVKQWQVDIMIEQLEQLKAQLPK